MMAPIFKFNGRPANHDENEPESDSAAETRRAIEAAVMARKRAELYITWLERALTPIAKPIIDRRDTETPH
jgi:hypothetical protein